MAMKKYSCINTRPETFEKFELILNFIKPKSTAIDLMEYIIDKFIETENIPIEKLSEIIKSKKIEVESQN